MLLSSGRFDEARAEGEELLRRAQKKEDLWGLFQFGFGQAWIDRRRSSHRAVVGRDEIRLAETDLRWLPTAAEYCVELGLDGPLARALAAAGEDIKTTKSRVAAQMLQLARASLALVRGRASEAGRILEPLRGTYPVRQMRHVLAHVYEARGLWWQAAGELEAYVIAPPREGWSALDHALPVAEQYRLAKLYERAGDSERARQWYQAFLKDWNDADPGTAEVAEARARLAAMGNPRAGLH